MNKSILCRKSVQIVLLFISFFFVFFMQSNPVMAAGSYRVDDRAGLLSDGERDALSNELDRISERYNVDIVILSLGEDVSVLKPTDYVDTYYVNNNLGLGPSQSGMLFMLSMAERDWAIATHGEAIDIFNDYAQEELMDKMIADLKANRMSSAFKELAAFSEMTLINAEKGIYAEAHISRPLTFYILPPILALFLTVIIMRSLKSPLSSVAFHSGAASYLLDDSMSIVNANDYFLSTSIARTAIPRTTDNKSGGSRSTTHTSSSGRTFGGSSGKF